MDVDKIINDIAAAALDQAGQKECNTDIILSCPVGDLGRVVSGYDMKDPDNQKILLDRWRNDIDGYIKEFLSGSDDPHAGDGLYKCSLETWKACANYIGLNYFRTYKLVRDYAREAWEGGARFNDDLIELGVILYEELCNKYRKQFFIYDSCKFLGMNLDSMYTLNDLHARYLKKAHSIQEDSMRTALASGRSNVTAMAILLNHDYDYTRTTQVIHTNGRDNLTADKLPQLTQDVVYQDQPQQLPGVIEEL